MRRRVLLIAAPLFLALAALIWFLSVRYGTQPVTPVALPDAPETPQATPATTTAATPLVMPSTSESPVASPPASSTPETSGSASATPESPPDVSQWNWPERAPAVNPSSPAAQAATDSLSLKDLVIPVAGVRPEQLQDTFNDARSEGRVHNAIDIIAPRGTPVLAVGDGKIVKLFQSVPGGITIYQLSADNKLVYYYAHLDRYADNLAEGNFARRGEIIGYVGDTGNATPGNYHLHFSISIISDPKRHWEGININPYPLLKK